MIRNLNINDTNYITQKMKYFNVNYNMDDIMNHPFNKYLIYELNNNQIGFVEYALYYDRIELNYIYIDEDYRKKGYGKEMLDYLLSLYKDIQNITLEVSETNYPAIKLYEKMGFEKVSIREKYYPNGDNALLMIRRF